MLAAKAPISNASVERTSKYSSALPPTRPTFFRSLMPPMPDTTVQKITSPMTILIILRKASPSGFNASPARGARYPTATPARMPASTCTYSAEYQCARRVSARRSINCPPNRPCSRPGPAASNSQSAHRIRNCATDLLGAGRATQVGRARSVAQHHLDSGDDGSGRVRMAKVLEHHRSRPDLPDRVGNVAAENIRRRAVDRLEHGGKIPFGIEIRGRGDPDRPRARRAEIRQDVAKQVGCNHDIEALGTLHEVGREDIDVIVIGVDIRVLLCHQRGPLVPEGHRQRNAVGF